MGNANATVSGTAAISDIPAFIRPTDVVLHLYSGRRRFGDVQAQVEGLTAHDEYSVLFILLDVAVNEQFGDLTNEDMVSFWVGEVASGRVIGGVSGPPCETWTALRWREIPGQRSPPVLRDQIHPWGRPKLTMPQYEQIAIGNQLLQVALLFSAALPQSGGFSLLEHPRQPKLPVRAASIWKLSYVKWMLQSPAVEVYSFEQGKHGQVSPKPTSVLLVRLAAVK